MRDPQDCAQKPTNIGRWQRVHTMLSELNSKISRRYFKAYETGDIDTVMEFIDPDYALHPGASGEPMNSEQRKRDELIFFSAFSNIQTIVEDQIAEGDTVANHITMHCTHTLEKVH